jgi:hypothetical protein
MAYQSTRTAGDRFVTYVGTMAQITADLDTDAVPFKQCQFVYDAGNSKFMCITDFQQS